MNANKKIAALVPSSPAKTKPMTPERLASLMRVPTIAERIGRAHRLITLASGLFVRDEGMEDDITLGMFVAKATHEALIEAAGELYWLMQLDGLDDLAPDDDQAEALAQEPAQGKAGAE